MRKAIIIIGLLLAGCSASAKYDLNIACSPTTLDSIDLDNGETRKIFCSSPQTGYSEVRCVKKTLQEVAGYRYCTTHDGKSVRIKILH